MKDLLSDLSYKQKQINLNLIHPMSKKQDLLKRIEALEISGNLIDDEIKRIEALKISRELIDEKIALANLSLENLEAEQEAIWKENQFVKDPTTRPFAEYCHSLGYSIVGCQIQEPESEFYPIAKKIWKFREDAVPFLKELYKRHGDKEFSYSIAELPDKKNLLNICTEMKKKGWISYTQNKSKTELLVTSSIPKKNKSFLNGGWAENVNRYFVNKVLTTYSSNHKKTIKYRVFWDVKLKLLESEKDNLNDMQLDIVVQINDRFYVFETKSGALGIQKWVERAEIFNQNGNRFLTCCIDSSVDSKLFQPYRLLSLEKLEEQLIELLDYDFSPAKS